MSIISARTLIATTPTPLWTDPAGAGADAKRRVATIYNTSGVTVYLGHSNCKPQRTLPATTGVATTDIFTSTGHGLAVDDTVIFTALTGGAGLVTNTVYLVATADTNTFTLKTVAGTAVNFTTDLTVATTTAGNYGYSLAASNVLHQFELDRGDMLYATVASGTQTICALVADI